MILLIDNYDSFTYNLFQQISMLGKEVKVVRNDEVTIEEIKNMQPEAIILSPGPGAPIDAGITIDVVKELYTKFPILGICLGHQSIGQAFGSSIVQAKHIMHGKLSTIQYEKTGLFAQLNGKIEVMRYHSLVIEPSTLHGDFNILAKSSGDGEIMAIQHKGYPLYGLQFHPESIGTQEGSIMMQTFLEQIS
ncbi:anthranilate synthase subunit II [Lysinibacillus sphaericus]|uniref:anthranilate synthase component II n=1 Tax=Lysinibacillus sphaericus TaxID=1421 RepID=UPI0018CF732E|nr:aminodeoxychorismate/anthranilate synthase component II [Lysinibacillus sphaericus]MBG9454070.1 anthranilate synthase subunit II [Lysinibacillus sphaericus]MBG9477383.1 anthranilate synthase subunit II [Lysinibacillus sphaericus]MBG9593565.1 anthranilate synthase subunit II [Lysinibacillus sphaericus]